MFDTIRHLSVINLSQDNNISTIKTFSIDDLKNYLENVTKDKSVKGLRDISKYLYIASPHYRALINYYSTLYTFDYVVEPYGVNPSEIKDIDKYKKSYVKSIDQIEKINIKKDSLKIRFSAYLEGVFFGYMRTYKDSFYIQKLDPEYCKITFINYETGQLGYAFDFSFFNKKNNNIDSYPDEFKLIWQDIQKSNNKASSKYWVNINSPNAVCIKSSPDTLPLPPFVGLFESILDIADFKALDKGKEEIGNYQLLFQKIPMDESAYKTFSAEESSDS